ncbi:hypothetical protein CBR_g11992 [Chara braunii]|uniref:Uncharacterized protein n=1 Tax=Chara braunii TaxID=69332 RepID=A0A388KR52_CHABU|nr:hypothetical protein CBR_g11992 [Chara braunii]|eukprot:GBG72413.1 hypothetical protein CBR_g11992 [Chara braunii]
MSRGLVSWSNTAAQASSGGSYIRYNYISHYGAYDGRRGSVPLRCAMGATELSPLFPSLPIYRRWDMEITNCERSADEEGKDSHGNNSNSSRGRVLSQVTADPPNLINDVLTDDALTAVLQCLRDPADWNSFSLVCRRWFNVESNTRQKITIFAVEFTERLLSRFPRLTDLDLSKCRMIDKTLISLSKGLRHIQRLDLSEAMITDISLIALAGSCRHLVSLILSRCTLITDDGVTILVRSLGQKLQSLNLSGCKRITDAAVGKVTGHCRQSLRELHLGHCNEITDAGLASFVAGKPFTALQTLGLDFTSHITDAGIAEVAKGCPSLTRLDISGTSITDSGLEMIAGKLSKLEHLIITQSGRVTDEGVVAVARKGRLKTLVVGMLPPGPPRVAMNDACMSGLALCGSLESLELDSCADMTDEGLATVARGCGKLKHLTLRSCDNVGAAGLSVVGDCCSGLEKLKLYGCSRVNDEALGCIARCKSLRSLEIDSTEDSATDAGLFAIATGCPRLVRVQVGYNNKFGDDGISAFLSQCKFLEELHCAGSRRITEAAFESVSCSASLRRLVLKRINLADDGLMMIASKCSGTLIHLDVTDCPMVSDVGCRWISNCSRLESLVMDRCRRVTDTGMAAIASGCRALRTLSAEGCDGISNVGIKIITEGCRCLREVKVKRM